MLKKLLPWNRLTKHLCVFFLIAIACASYFWAREALIALVALMIPLVHRIEKDYRSRQKKCPKCRRYKCLHEFDRTLCLRCVQDNERLASTHQSLVRRPFVGQSPFPGADKMPPKPQLPTGGAQFSLIPK